MGSPRLGSLVGRFDPEHQAEVYAQAGAAALSVVVEPDFFFGSYELLRALPGSVGPAGDRQGLRRLRAPARRSRGGRGRRRAPDRGALLGSKSCAGWADAARARGLVPLVETHDAEDIELADGTRRGSWSASTTATCARFEVDLEALDRVCGRAFRPARSRSPRAASRGRADVERLAAAGFDAFLVGEIAPARAPTRERSCGSSSREPAHAARHRPAVGQDLRRHARRRTPTSRSELGADLIGLNFWNGSPRRVDSRRGARDRGARSPAARSLVGVFVNETPERIDELVADARPRPRPAPRRRGRDRRSLRRRAIAAPCGGDRSALRAPEPAGERAGEAARAWIRSALGASLRWSLQSLGVIAGRSVRRHRRGLGLDGACGARERSPRRSWWPAESAPENVARGAHGVGSGGGRRLLGRGVGARGEGSVAAGAAVRGGRGVLAT